MARLRILELPTIASDERPPFAVVIDRIGEGDGADVLRDDLNKAQDAAERLGARCILGFAETIDIPDIDHPLRMVSFDAPARAASDTVDAALAVLVLDTLGIDLTDGQPVPAFALDSACRQVAKSEAARQHLRDDIKAMSRQLREAFGVGNDPAIDVLGSAVAQLADARMWARHGYEIGQRHCGWSDHGVAPAWLTKDWPKAFDSCEHLTRASEYDTALSQVRGLSERPEAVDPSKPYSDDYLLGYRMAISTAKSVASNEPPARPQEQALTWCKHACSCEHDQQDHSTSGYCNGCGMLCGVNDGHYPSECPEATQ